MAAPWIYCRQPPMGPVPGWVYAVLGEHAGNPIIKVGRTEREHPGSRAIETMPRDEALDKLQSECYRLWASRSSDIVRDERAAHKALDGYRFREMRRLNDRWADVAGRELFVCDIPKVLDVLEEATGNRPFHFPKFLEECGAAYTDWLLTSSAAVLAGDPSDQLDYQAIRRDWTEFPRGPRTCAE